MCGIVGLASPMSISNRDVLLTQRDSMIHRGPDDKGIWWSDDGRVGLAHRRLSILDLSPAGHQPMLNEHGNLAIVFNGEIYNYHELKQELASKGYIFRSKSDTEVLLAAYQEWGVDCLRYLNGMFAFGLYDGGLRRLFLARDRAGEKPLFYSHNNARFSFASELKALMADPEFERRLDLDGLDCYLAFGYVPGNLCILQGVKKLPPASAITYDLCNGYFNVWRYWQLPPPRDKLVGPAKVNETALLVEIESLLEDAVSRQLVADVPVGILLSGGLDSSLITAIAARSTSNIKTFTIRFPGAGKYDETAHARVIARHFGTEQIELEASASSTELLPLLAHQFDEPMVDSSMIPTYLVSSLVKQHCTVALGGDGGDELFGGYGHYGRLMRLRKWLPWFPFILRQPFCRLGQRLLPPGFKGKHWLGVLECDLINNLPLLAKCFNAAERRRLLPLELTANVCDEGFADFIHRQRIPKVADLLERSTRLDFENYLPEDILVKVDRCSMLNSLEVRAPWLDYRIIEFAFGKTPSYLKATATEAKILPKRLAIKLLPPEFDIKRKQGFSVPLSLWLKTTEWLEFFREILLGSDNTLFNRKFVNQLFRENSLGFYNGERLFALVIFELWRNDYKIMI